MSDQFVWHLRFKEKQTLEIWCNRCRSYSPTLMFALPSKHSMEHNCADKTWEINAPEYVDEYP